MSTKIEVVKGAYSQVRISGLTIQPGPEDVELALERLETMMAELYSRNICLNYNFEEVPDANSETGVSRQFDHMMQTNLAVRVVPDFNKEPTTTLVFQASQSLSNASGHSARQRLNQVPYPSRQPVGNANSLRYSWWRRFYPHAVLPDNSCSSHTLAVGNIEDFTEPFEAYLSGETIQSFTKEATNGLTVTNDVINGNNIDYRVEAISGNTVTGSLQFVTFDITTNTGRKTTRAVEFQVIGNGS